MTAEQLQECAAKDRGSDITGPCTNFRPSDGFSTDGDDNRPSCSCVVDPRASPKCDFPPSYLKINSTTGCNPGWSYVNNNQDDGPKFDPEAAEISGSFHWKVTHAAAHGCVPVGGTYWVPGAGSAKAAAGGGGGSKAADGAGGAPNQAFFCPAAMQAGEPPNVVAKGQPLTHTNCERTTYSPEPNGGATWKDYAAASRSWGECHIPQTETLGPESCRAKL